MVRGFETGGNQLSDNITLLDTSTASEKRYSTDSNFPVLPVAITVIVSSIIVTVLVTLYLVRRQRQAEKYKQYSQIAETAVQPPQFSVKTTQQPFPAKKKLCRTKEKIISSEESLSPMSSEEMFFDAQERLEGKASRSISSREASPASALEEEEKEEDEVYPVDHLGRIWFNLEYDKSAESLAVTLVKARNLSTRGKASKTCDPFVKLRILGPEEKERNVSQSKSKRKTCRPNFDEMFYFNMPVSELKRCTLRLSVYDGFRASQQSVIGEVLFPLSELDTDQKLELWRDLAANEESPSELGEIHISMSYYPTLDRLTIIVLRASNLKKMEPHGTDSYPKVTFSIGNKIIKTKKGPLHHGSRDPLYNESFNFSVSGDDLGSGTLLVSIMHSRGGGKEDHLVGRVLLGGMMYARGTECEHWTEMMTNPRNMIKYWHKLTS